MSARIPISRSDAPLPRAKRPAQRQREELEERGQLALFGGCGNPDDVRGSHLDRPSKFPRTGSTTRPSIEDCRREPWRAFE